MSCKAFGFRPTAGTFQSWNFFASRDFDQVVTKHVSIPTDEIPRLRAARDGHDRLFATTCGPTSANLSVSGRVVRKSGQVVSKGAVQFRPLADTTQSAIGEIQPDGSYELQSVFGNELVPGGGGWGP